MQTVKEIIDEHFKLSYRSYRARCYSYYKGGNKAEDLLHETYIDFLKVKPEVIYKFHALGRLHNIGLKLIRSLYQDRHRSKKNRQGSTSPLADTTTNYPVDTVAVEFEDSDNDHEITHELFYNKSQQAIAKALSTQNEGTNHDSDYMKVSIFLQSLESPILEISRKTKIPRYYLSNLKKEGQQLLKEAITK